MSYAASLFLTLYNTFPIKTICPKGPIFLNGHSDHFKNFSLYTCTKRAEGKFCKSENKINKKLILNILNFFSSIKLCHLCTPNFQPWAFFFFTRFYYKIGNLWAHVHTIWFCCRYTERTTKTRTGADIKDVRKIKPKAYTNPYYPERCPVTMYKKYRDHRPAKMTGAESPFFVAINHTHCAKDEEGKRILTKNSA
jgi:hypothetical protein